MPMAEGLRYEVHKMPPGMRERVMAQVLEKVSARAGNPDEAVAEVKDGPCATCLRWWECNGVDKEYCPLWGR